MPSITDYLDLLERMPRRSLAVTPSHCIMVRNRNVTCLRCAESCLGGCISIVDNHLAIDTEACIACGCCAAACPTAALAPRMPTDDALAEAAWKTSDHNDGTVVIACAPAVERAKDALDPESVASVPCLGRIDEGLVASFLAAGARGVRLVSEECAACEISPGGERAQRAAESTKALLAPWGLDGAVQIGPRFPRCCARSGHATFDGSRRRFFGAVADEAKAAATETAAFALARYFPEDDRESAPVVDDAGMLPRLSPPRRRRLCQALEDLGPVLDEMVDCDAFGHAMVDAEKCTSCTMCAVFCPTGALSLVESEKGRILEHHPRLCTKCRTCEQICPAGALRLSDAVFIRDVCEDRPERTPLRDLRAEKGGPDSIRRTMAHLIDSPYLWG